MSKRAAKRSGWRVLGGGRSMTTFPTKTEAVEHARRRARTSGFGQIVLHPGGGDDHKRA